MKGNLDNVTLEDPVDITDWMPTFLEIAGLEKRLGNIEGKSIRDLIYGKGEVRNRKIYIRGHLQESVITKKWKIIRTRYSDKEPEYELFQIEADPEEQHNVFTEYPEVASELKQKLEQEFLKDANEVNFTPNDL